MPAAARPGRAAVAALLTCSIAGVVHGLFSLYWAVGGNWLTITISDQLAAFAGRRWLLFPVGVIKVGFALLPLMLLVRGWPVRQLSRLVCWLGAAVLVLWGGVNTVTGNLVLTGLIHPAGGYDRPGMVGHAWLWDPLFLIWGSALTIALMSTRGSTQLARHG